MGRVGQGIPFADGSVDAGAGLIYCREKPSWGRSQP